ncbi:hypothetical protein Pla22_27270 [Rubripirellula amarantea]|uniref:Legionella pneumophila major outer membrane protein n=1 Tax=Rubripirellula amarantea TaxID=2527999 RepID=A0A5C5WYK4_9BACT|nr:hypothetical protein [Rubripirellula amarantea]TWT55073.1 hypothetical protein Pla22_27270 [Rubripirellula amarantea]
MKTIARFSLIACVLLMISATAHAQSCGCESCSAGFEDCCDAPGLNLFEEGVCDSGACADPCGPKWTTSAWGLFLDRDAPSGGIPLVSQNAGSTLLTTDDLEPSTGSGFGVSLGFARTKGSRFEFTFLNSDWDLSNGLAGNGNLNSVLGTVDYTLADRIDISYDSEIQSFELNHWVDTNANFSWMFGARYFSLDESFRLTGTDGNFVSNYDIDTQNDMFGGQLGASIEETIVAGFLRGHVTGKVGIFGNEASSDSMLRDVNNTVEFRSSSVSNTDAAFLGDVDAGITACVSEMFQVRAGYQMLWLNDVALAPEQFQGNAASPEQPINSSGKLFMSGAYIGAMISW